MTGFETHPEDAEFLRAWSEAVGKPGYDKDDWKRRQRELYARLYGKDEPMKRVVWICDWCGTESPTVDDQRYPNGWADNDGAVMDRGQPLLCDECRDAVNIALVAVEAARKRLRLALGAK